MAAVVVELANAVVAALNGATLSQEFTAERAYVPIRDVKDFGDAELRVLVVPTGLRVAARDLGPRLTLEWELGVWLQQRAGRDTGDTDPLMLLAQEVIELFHGWRTGADHRVIGIEARPPFDPQSQDVIGVFSATIYLTFRDTP